MAVWTDLLDDVLPEINGAPPQALVTHQIKLTVIDFMLRTALVTRMSGTFDLVGGNAERVLPVAQLSATEQVGRFLEVFYLNKPLDYKTGKELAEIWPDWKSQVGTPRYWTQERDGAFWLAPSPAVTEANALRARFSVAPTRAAAGFDDWVLNKYGETIARGAKGRLMGQSNRPWSNPNLAVVNYQAYEDAIESAHVAALKRAGKLQTGTSFL